MRTSPSRSRIRSVAGAEAATSAPSTPDLSERGIDWRPAGWLPPVVAVAVLAGLAMVAAGRVDLLVFAAPLVGGLAGAWWGMRPERAVGCRAVLSADRVFVGEAPRLTVELDAPAGIELLDVTVATGPELAPFSTGPTQWELRAVRSGRATVRVDVVVGSAGGLLVGQARVLAASVVVFPSAKPTSAVPRPVELPDLLGEHVGRRAGAGVEFAGVREYRPGDPVRAMNWPVTARLGRPHVTERLAEQAARVVALIDVTDEIRQPGPSTLELSVHGALGVARGALRRGDRAGVATFGGEVRWLSPDLGQRQYYRVLELLLDARPAGRESLEPVRFPVGVLPWGAALVVFSPLLDERVIAGVGELRRRGFGLVVVDVLRVAPRPRPDVPYDLSAVRMWRLGRRGIRHRLGDLGVPVLTWHEGAELDEILRLVARRPLLGGRR